MANPTEGRRCKSTIQKAYISPAQTSFIDLFDVEGANNPVTPSSMMKSMMQDFKMIGNNVANVPSST